MNHITILLALLAAGWGTVLAAPPPTNSATANRILMIDPSSMWIGEGKATLIIGPLERADGIYTGDYNLKVFPWYFKSDKGRLSIIVSDATQAETNQGRVVAVTGTATATGGECRHIEATATPADIHHGMLKLWFTVGKRTMIFSPAYHLVGKATAPVPSQTKETQP